MSINIVKEVQKSKGKFVNPSKVFENVFVFSIHRFYLERKNLFDATRMHWSLSQEDLELKPAHAVGVISYQSFSAYEVNEWKVSDLFSNKYKFDKDSNEQSVEVELVAKDWSNILKKVDGYYRYGGLVIVEFDGEGRFKFVKGSEDSNTWYDCV